MNAIKISIDILIICVELFYEVLKRYANILPNAQRIKMNKKVVKKT